MRFPPEQAICVPHFTYSSPPLAGGRSGWTRTIDLIQRLRCSYQARVLCAPSWSRLYSIRPLVGLDGLEPSTSRLSGARSNHLSYRPFRSPGVLPVRFHLPFCVEWVFAVKPKTASQFPKDAERLSRMVSRDHHLPHFSSGPLCGSVENWWR